MDQTLTITGDGYAIAIAPECLARRADLLAASAHVVAVNDDGGAEQAREAMKALKAFENAAEKSRETVKAPVLEVGRRIDTAAKTLLESVRAEGVRLSNLVKGYAAICDKRRREVEDAARQAAFEAERKRKAEAAAAEAERLAAERLAQRATSKTIEAARAAETAAAEARAAAEAAELEQSRAGFLAMRTNVAPAGTKPIKDFEIVDVRDLAAKHPDLVVITPRRREILDLIRSANPPAISGIKVIETFTVSTR